MDEVHAEIYSMKLDLSRRRSKQGAVFRVLEVRTGA